MSVPRLTDNDAKEARRVSRKIDSIRGGPGILVAHTASGVTVTAVSKRAPRGGSAQGFIPVHATNDGGTYGSSTTSNTATYTVKTLGDKDMADGASTTATHKTPEWNERIAHVAYLPPPTGAICIACYDTATPPALHLLYVPEKFGGTDCNTPGSGS